MRMTCLTLLHVQESNGEVLRLPVMSKKMTMAGELEVTGSVAGGAAAAAGGTATGAGAAAAGAAAAGAAAAASQVGAGG